MIWQWGNSHASIALSSVFTAWGQLPWGQRGQPKGQERRKRRGIWLLCYRIVILCCTSSACLCEDELRAHLVSVPVRHHVSSIPAFFLARFFSFFGFLLVVVLFLQSHTWANLALTARHIQCAKDRTIQLKLPSRCLTIALIHHLKFGYISVKHVIRVCFAPHILMKAFLFFFTVYTKIRFTPWVTSQHVSSLLTLSWISSKGGNKRRDLGQVPLGSPQRHHYISIIINFLCSFPSLTPCLCPVWPLSLSNISVYCLLFAILPPLPLTFPSSILFPCKATVLAHWYFAFMDTFHLVFNASLFVNEVVSI